MPSAWERLDALLGEPRDVHVQLDVQSETCWACELKVVTAHRATEPDHGITVYAAAGGTAEQALARVLDEWDKLAPVVPASVPLTSEDYARAYGLDEDRA